MRLLSDLYIYLQEAERTGVGSPASQPSPQLQGWGAWCHSCATRLGLMGTKEGMRVGWEAELRPRPRHGHAGCGGTLAGGSSCVLVVRAEAILRRGGSAASCSALGCLYLAGTCEGAAVLLPRWQRGGQG